MSRASHCRIVATIAATLALAAGLTACDTMPMGPQGQVSPYPGQAQQYPNQYPGQYPNQSQYPAQTQYPAQGQQPNYVEYGRVTNMEVFQTQEQGRGTGLGAVLGGVAGAVVGNQIGGGTGRSLATIAGGVGGAVAGNAIEKNRNSGVAQAYRVTVQLDSGGGRSYDMPATGELRIGDRVRIQNGQLFRY